MRAMRIRAFSLILAGLLAAPLSLAAEASGKCLVYVGTYTGGSSKGIYAWRFDGSTGKAEPLGLAAETPNPSFLALHPNGKFLYAVQETGTFKGEKGGGLRAFAVDRATGKLSFLNEQPSGGADPCHLAVDGSGQCLLAANYSGGSVISLPIAQDGSLAQSASFVQYSGRGVNPARQEAPHAHSINLSPDGRTAVVADLGLDLLHVYRVNALAATLNPVEFPFARTAPGAGPRHLVFQADGRFVYVLNELACTITSYAFDAQAATLLERSTVPTLPAEARVPNTCAEIRIHPNGRTLYASNRGHDSLAVFEMDGRGGLKLLQHVPTGGKTPRNFALDPSGRYLFAANQNSDAIVVFKVDPGTGCLSPTGETLKVGSPVCVRFLPVE